MRKSILDQELTDKDKEDLQFLKDNPEYNLVVNEDSMKAWIDNGKTKTLIPYNRYLRFVHNKKIVCFRSDIDNLIFWNKPQDDENNWGNGIFTFMPDEPGLYEVMTETGTLGKAFCAHNLRGDMVWVSPVAINVWR